VRFEAPLKFYRQQPRRATWRALVTSEGSGLIAHVTLESVRELRAPKTKEATQRVRHFSGRVYLEPLSTHAHSRPLKEHIPVWNGRMTLEPTTIYRVYFHGPTFQVLAGAQASPEQAVGRLCDRLLPITTSQRRTLLTPQLIELCLQTAGVWEFGKAGTLALPAAIERVEFYPPQACTGQGQAHASPLYAEIKPRQEHGGQIRFDARVVDEQGNVYLKLYGYRTAR
jgi:hypothetical protein